MSAFKLRMERRAADIDLHNVGSGTFTGPKRWIQHTSRTQLVWEYAGWAKSREEDAASYSVFLRVANKVMGPRARNTFIGIRKSSEHTQCNVCYTLKAAIRKCSKKMAQRQDSQGEGGAGPVMKG